jgi:hypothetical protein
VEILTLRTGLSFHFAVAISNTLRRDSKNSVGNVFAFYSLVNGILPTGRKPQSTALLDHPASANRAKIEPT